MQPRIGAEEVFRAARYLMGRPWGAPIAYSAETILTPLRICVPCRGGLRGLLLHVLAGPRLIPIDGEALFPHV